MTTEYEFSLSYALAEDDRDHAAIHGRLIDLDRGDVAVGSGNPDLILIEYCCEAASAVEAVLTAISDMRVISPGARLIEMTPDLVGMSDVAGRMNVSRQAIHKAWQAQKDFPNPLYSQKTATVWHLADVLAWFKDRPGYIVEAKSIETALMARAVNGVIAARGQKVDGIAELIA